VDDGGREPVAAAGPRVTEPRRVDYRLLFASTTSAVLVLDLDLVVVDVTPAFCTLLGRTCEELLGRGIATLFPENPGDSTADGLQAVLTSLETVRDTGERHTLPLQRYDIKDRETGEYSERYWSIVNSPVRDDDGAVVLLMNRVEDVTGYVRNRADQAHREWAEQEVYARTREVQAAWEAEARASRRVAALAGVAVAMADARTIAEVTDLVIGRGLTALGANGGAVAVRGEGDTLLLTITDSLGEETVSTYAELPRTGPLPACVSTATGERVLLRDRAESLAFAPEMAEVLLDTGCQAWASLPLRGSGQVLGSLTVGWAHPHDFPAGEVELLDAFAQQCGHGIERIVTREAERAAAAATRGMAEVLQMSLLTEPVQPDHLQVAVRYRPAADGATIGGDWYDAFLNPDEELSLVIGDIAGHDRRAAAAMGQARNLLRGITFGVGEPPAAILAALDRAMRHFAVNSLATAILAQVEQTATDAVTGRRRVRWSNAGHPPPLLLQPDGSAELLHTPAELLLGVVPHGQRADHEALLPIGATLLLYTDGLVERRGVDLDDGLAQLSAVARALAGLDLETFCDELLVRMVCDGEDDVALLALRAHDPALPRPPEAGPEVLHPS
jgi:PAS domain S-box-containing protein